MMLDELGMKKSISIHAPREGSDWDVLDMVREGKSYFNPRSP